MEYMFVSSGIEDVDLSCLDTRNVIDMTDMFFTTEIKILDLPNFNFDKLEDEHPHLFGRCCIEEVILSKSYKKIKK